MKCRKIENVSLAVWQDVVDKSPHATFYHTPAWADILCKTFPRWQNVTFGLEFEDGNRAIFPLFRRQIIRPLPFYWHESSVIGTYGGPVFEITPSQEQYNEVVADLIREKTNISVVSNPFVETILPTNVRHLQLFVQTLGLEYGFSETWKGYSNGRQRAIRKALREGVCVRQVEFLDYYQTYYEIYLSQLKRWGKNASGNYPMELFHNLARLSNANPSVKYFGAFLKNKMIGGLIVFYHNKYVTLGFVATMPEFLNYHPEDVLLSDVVEKGCVDGFQNVDFGTSGGRDGIAKYKEYFGTVKHPLYYWQQRNILGFIYRGERFIKNYFGKCPEG
jgi:hypothetical protein